MWRDESKQIIFYPRFLLIAWKGMLIRHIEMGDLAEIPFDKFNTHTSFNLHWNKRFHTFDFVIHGDRFHLIFGIQKCIGMQCVRIIQKCWRKWATAKWQQRALAVAMGLHNRLGAKSIMGCIDDELMHYIVRARV